MFVMVRWPSIETELIIPNALESSSITQRRSLAPFNTSESAKSASTTGAHARAGCVGEAFIARR